MRQRSDYPTFSDQEMARRHQAIQTLMDQEGVRRPTGLRHRPIFLRHLLANRLAEQP